MNWLFASGGQIIGAAASSLFNEYSELISFRIHWLDILASLSRLGKVKCRPANCGRENYNKELKNLQAQDFFVLFCFTTNHPDLIS